LSIPELDVVIAFQKLRAHNEHPTDDDSHSLFSLHKLNTEMVHWLEMEEDITCGTLVGCGYRFQEDFEHLLLMKKTPVYAEDTKFQKRKNEKSLEEDYCIKSAATTYTICAHKISFLLPNHVLLTLFVGQG
jgi:hypothetical protein